MGEGGFQTRAYRRERLSASTIAYRRADTWVRPYGWAREHPPPARQWRAGFKPAPTGGNGCRPATLPTGGRTRGSAPTAGHARIPLTPVKGGRVSNPRLQAGTAVRQQHCLPAGGHVGPPLRLVTRASPSRPSMEGGFKPAPTGGNGCPPAPSPTGGRTRGSAPTAGHARIPLPPVKGGRVSNPRLQAGTAVGQHHRLPAGGHVGPPLRLVTPASLYQGGERPGCVEWMGAP